ncbi:MAG: hydroxylamine reductase [Pseudomonadota bacterium]
MFCYQCEQTAKGSGCTVAGVCGKDAPTAALQDLLVHTALGLATVAWPARQLGVQDPAADRFVLEALFTTITNVNFDPERLASLVRRGARLSRHALAAYLAACEAQGATPTIRAIPPHCVPADDLDGMVLQGEAIGIQKRFERVGEVVTGLQELVMYGLKGMAAYADHALILGHTDQTVADFFLEALAFLAHNPQDVAALTAMALRVGEVNITVMALLDAANTGHFGHPEPTPVRVEPVTGKAILVSGHDLLDLAALLEQTAGMGLNVYTHGELLPAHGYPELKKHPHLVGNYGGAWQDQAKEFDAFPGAILMTTNCIQRPRPSYKQRIFTTGLVAWPGVAHVERDDFGPVIEAALAAPGFTEDGSDKTILVGFGHHAVLGVADRVVEAVKTGAIKHFFLIGGCDGAKSGRNYFTDLARSVPQDAVILTLACGKYRFNKLEFGTIGGIPRLLDIGQCNDAYSAVVIAQALACAFDTDVNGLPLSLVLSWYEQKAVVILLSLLHLGVRDIRLGPTLPAFVTPPVLQVLVEGFALKPTGTVEEDLAACLAGH